MDLKSFTSAIQQIAEEKGIPREKIFETIEMALAAAYKRDYGKRGQIVRAKLNPESGSVVMTQIKIVVDESMLKPEEEDAEEAPEIAARGRRRDFEPEDEEISAEKKVRFNPEKHLMLDEAQKIKPDAAPGEELVFPITYDEVAGYGRIAAQTAKQVILQRIREAEREAVFNEYKDKEGELANGLVQRVEGRNVYVDIGRSAGMLPPEEQIPGEHYRIGERVKVLIALVEKNPRGPGIFLSRTHPRLLKKLFELEVPEIATGAVEIKAIAREPGSRSKVAAVSHESGVDPVGSLVGQKGVRVSTVIQELGGEKIDIIAWSDDPKELIAHALSPAKVISVEINEHRHDARVTVPEDQLSLAIGKRGQNVRLAAKLTGWKIDVRPPFIPETEAAESDETIADVAPDIAPNE
ncbi:MAG: transcription termination factor NusA [Candidatus Sungiibacteriota bacterium]